MANEELIKEIIDDTYINWLEKQLEQNEEISSVNISDNIFKNNLSSLKYFYQELLLYQIECQKNFSLAIFLKKGKDIYVFKIDKDNQRITCKKYTFPQNPNLNISLIEYKKFKLNLIEKILTTNLSHIISQAIKDPLKLYCEICYAMPPEERILILKHLQNKSCQTCTNGSCNVQAWEKVGIDESGYPMGHNCIGWFNPSLIGKSRVLAKLDINKLKRS